MTIFKGTFFYTDDYNTTGFTHSWWTDAPDYDTAKTQLYPFWQKLRPMLVTFIRMQVLRISNKDPARDSMFYPPVDTERTGAMDPAANTPIGYAQALLVRRDAGVPNVFGHLFIHGLPISQFSGRSWTPDIPTQGIFNLLVTEVTNNQYLLRKKITAGPPPTYANPTCASFVPRYQTSHRVGRPTDPLRGKRRIA